jgi:hypothetical protein
LHFAADPVFDLTFDDDSDPDTSDHFDADAYSDPAPAFCQSDANLRPIAFSLYSHGFILSLLGPLCAVHGPP